MERLNHSELQKRQELYKSLTDKSFSTLEKIAAGVAAAETAAHLGNVDMSRRKFLRLTGLIGATTIACPGPVSGPIEAKNPYVQFLNQDIFDGHETGGEIIVNGLRITSGDILEIKGGMLHSIDIEVSGYYPAYLIGVSGTDVLYYRDREGCHGTKIDKNMTLAIRAIPEWFDVAKFGQSIGKPSGPKEDLDFVGDGTVQNFGKRDIDVSVWELGQTATPAITSKTIESIKLINKAAKKYVSEGVINLNYVGKRDTYLTDGITHAILDHAPIHVEVMDGNKITRAWLETKNTALLSTVLEELLQTTGIRDDGNTPSCIYVNTVTGKLVNNAPEAIYLINQLPRGFLFDVGDVPSVKTSCAIDARSGFVTDPFDSVGGPGSRSRTGYRVRGESLYPVEKTRESVSKSKR